MNRSLLPEAYEVHFRGARQMVRRTLSFALGLGLGLPAVLGLATFVAAASQASSPYSPSPLSLAAVVFIGLGGLLLPFLLLIPAALHYVAVMRIRELQQRPMGDIRTMQLLGDRPGAFLLWVYGDTYRVMVFMHDGSQYALRLPSELAAKLVEGSKAS